MEQEGSQEAQLDEASEFKEDGKRIIEMIDIIEAQGGVPKELKAEWDELWRRTDAYVQKHVKQQADEAMKDAEFEDLEKK